MSSTFPEFQAVDPKLTESPCGEWRWIYTNSANLLIISGALIGVINGVCCALFENIVMFEGCLTYMDEVNG